MRPEFYLTPQEEILVGNSEWLLTKHKIIGKVFGVFGGLNEDFKAILHSFRKKLPPEVPDVSGKIFKGEQYRQLPYVMLDQPRYFKGEDIFAIRSLFWWGNHFSIHLLLSGKYRLAYEAHILQQVKQGLIDDWFWGIGPTPWEHHFEPDNYLPVGQLRKEPDSLTTVNYIKLAKYHPLSDWKSTGDFYRTTYKHLLNIAL